jgi:putative chitinase
MNITAQQLANICSPMSTSTAEQFVEPLNTTFAKYDITTSLRAAAFVSQCAHESEEFTRLSENLNYTAAALLHVYPKYFSESLAEQYARNPQAIANRVYANRMGNGDEQSGDGWTFRGRGLIQLTGRSTYAKFAYAVGRSLDDAITYLESTEGAAVSAGWFWSANNLNGLADAGNFTEITQRINGGQDGALDRERLYKKALAVL